MSSLMPSRAKCRHDDSFSMKVLFYERDSMVEAGLMASAIGGVPPGMRLMREDMTSGYRRNPPSPEGEGLGPID